MVSPELLNIPVTLASGVTCRVSVIRRRRASAQRTVVCMHGLTRNARDFDALADALAVDYQIVCLDMPGRGNSDWLKDPAEYNYPNYVTATLHVLNHLAIAQVDWIGTSMGGIIGMMLANAAPGLIQRLILNDIGALVPAAGLRRIMSYVGVNTTFSNRASAESALRETLKPFGLRNEQQWRQLLNASIRELPDGTACLAYDPAISASLPKGEDIKEVNLWPLWDGIAPIQALVIRGADSDILTADTAEEMKASHPCLKLVEIPDTGHAPALLADDQIGLIRQWLAAV